MRIVPVALAGSALVLGLATVAFAQSPPTPSNPNTKVYAYKKAAPGSAAKKATLADGPNRAELADPPPFGSPKWWEEKSRNSSGTGGD
jgi:hypothetical protein